MTKNILSLAVISALAIGFNGCSSDSDSNSNTNSQSNVITSTATLSDSKVAGVTYTCGSMTGVTDVNGTFSYTNECNEVSFNIGAISLGSMLTNKIQSNSTIYPSDILGLNRNETNSTTLINILQVLQSLDSDGNPNNGINISATTRTMLTGISPVNLDSNTTQMSSLTSLATTAGKTLINRNYAVAHYEDTLRKDLNISVDTVPPAPALLATVPSPTNENNTSIQINGEVGAKIFINNINTGIIIDTNNTATIYLDTTGADGNKTSTITLQDDANQTSDDLNVTLVKDATAPQYFISNININENQLSVMDINATDVNTIIYSLSGIDSNSFDINSTSGVLTFKNNPDYETKTSYDINITAKDIIGNINTQHTTISLNNLNDTSPIITSSNIVVNENQTSVFTVTSTDSDNLNEIFSYSISGTDATSFDINSSTGVLTFKNNPDYETKTNYDLNITVSDGIHNTSKEFRIGLNNLNDVSPQISTTNTTVNENQTDVFTLVSNDNDNLNETFTYSISGADSTSFEINSSTGVLTFKNNPDYETKTNYELNITVNDGTNSSSKVITVDIGNIDDVIPTFTTNEQITVNENSSSFTIVAEDDFPITYSLGTTFDSSLFTIDSSTGIVTFKDNPDYENPHDENRNNSYSVVVKISDTVPEHTQEKLYIVNITNLDDVPAPSSLTDTTINGMISNGSAIAGATIYLQAKDKTLRSTTSDVNGNYTFDISGLTGPFMFFATMTDSTRLYSYNNGTYAHTNITPITSLMLANVAQNLNSTLDDMFIDFSTFNTTTFNTSFTNAYTTIGANLTTSLSSALLTNFNHFYNSFSYTGYNYDRVIQSYDTSLSYSNVALRINNTLITSIADINTSSLSDMNTTGTVLDNSGTAINNAIINLYYDINGTRYDINTTTDANGAYTITVPNYRVYNINIISSLLNMTYTNLNTFYSNLATLQLANINLVDSSTNISASGTIKNGRTSANITSAIINIRSGYNNTSGDIIATATTNNQGDYSISSLPKGSYTIEVKKDGYYPTFSNKVFITDTTNLDLTLLADNRETILDRDAFATIVLTWGSTPNDLDSHLYISTSADNSTRDEVYYGDKVVGSASYVSDRNNPCATSGVISSLDLDDTSGNGPETTSICERYNQKSHFYVRNYSGYSHANVSAEAKVIVRKFDGSTYEITPPSTNPNNYNYWKVFDIDSSGNIIPINEYRSSKSDN